MRKLFLLVVFFQIALFSEAQRSYPDTLHAYYTVQKIDLDGKLTEECWQNAMHIHNFTQRE
ncbi:MAG: hypothetical protein DRI72_08370, partial [Bacteroidetes bacterium]